MPLAFTFRLEFPGRPAPLIKIRTFDQPSEAVERGRRLLEEWPDCLAVDVSQRDRPLARLTRDELQDEVGAQA